MCHAAYTRGPGVLLHSAKAMRTINECLVAWLSKSEPYVVCPLRSYETGGEPRAAPRCARCAALRYLGA